MTRPITIALDAMGGDIGPEVVVPAALDLLEARGDLQLILVGRPEVLEAQLVTNGGLGRAGLRVHAATEVVGMDEPPAQSLKRKKDSSMRVAIDLVKRGEADACVSAGNTGALMATARFVLRTLPGIDRPAICTTLPTVHGHVHMLDLGANADCKPEHLLQFAVMGAELARAVDGLPAPRVALLNIGSEDIKGNDLVKETHALLGNSDLNYIGYVEGDGVYLSPVDVVVCDGFVGNVALKTSEGVAKLVRHFINEEFRRSLPNKLAGLVAGPVLRAFAKRIDPRRYNGASLLGLNGIVIKSHGGADRLAFGNAIRTAVLEVDKNVPALIKHHLGALHAGGDAT